MNKKILVLVAIAAGAGGVGAALSIDATHAAATELAPHRAAYTMSLNSARLSGGVSGASGAMTYKFQDSCDGWTVENKTILTLAYAEGGQVATTWDFVTWESKDGLSYRFHVRSTRDGAVTEEIDGTAKLDGKGKGGVARFTQPEPKTIKLPEGTLFPTDHTVRLIEAARGGSRNFNRVVFDGSGDEGPFDVTAFLGTQLLMQPQKANADALDPLLSSPSWRVHMAFFPLSTQQAEPDYEVAVRYHANGVADELVQTFNSFSLRGHLDKLEPLPKSDC